MKLSTLATRLDDRLRTDAYADLDASANGLQIGPGGDAASNADREVRTVAVAVDAAVATAEAAADRGTDCLIAHHGLSWGGIERVTGQAYERVAALIENDLALYVSHLPLDGHPELGNAAGLADLLELDDREPFGELGGEHIGRRGRCDPRDPEQVRTVLERLDTGGSAVDHLDFGPDEITDVAVVTGGGADWFGEARREGVDAFVTGEGKGKLYHEAREAGVHVYLAGHYATETSGVRALAELVESWGLATTFVDHPTGL
jgi:dinuclear metal center YbgI/SA1388 family protein